MPADHDHDAPANDDDRRPESGTNGLTTQLEPLPVAILLFRDRILFANREAERVTGFRRDQLCAMTPLDLVHEDGRGGNESFTELVDRKRELQLLNGRGDTRWVEMRCTNAALDDGDCHLVTIHDITRCKRTESSELMLAKAVETTQIGVTVTDTFGTIVYTNPAEAAMHGYTVDELIGRDVRLFAPRGLWQPMSQAQLCLMKSLQRESLNVRKDGSVFPVRLLSDVVTDDEGEPIAVVSTTEDISGRRRAEQALRNSEERYALAARGANDGLWDWDLKHGKVYFSPRWKSLLGFRDSEIGDDPEEWFGRVHPDDVKRLRIQVENHLAGKTPHLECEYRMLHADDEWRWLETRGLAVSDNDEVVRMSGSQTDITKRKRAEEQLTHNALHDPLTGLPNRALFLDRLDHEIRRSRRRHGPRYGVLCLDLDRFKLINESLGHEVGDQLLEDVAERIGECLRPGDTLARLPGGGFAVLLEELGGANHSIVVAERIQEALGEGFLVQGHEIFASASIGITLSSPDYDRPEDVLRDADTAMYRAKAIGGTGYQIFDSTMHARAVALLQLETNLRRALDRSELRVHYQPIVELGEQRIVGFEALVRWQHPAHGMVPAETFIRVAEETGLIIRLGEWVLGEACDQLGHWEDEGYDVADLTLGVNLSAKELLNQGQATEIKRLIESSTIEPGMLTLEITESGLMKQADSATAVLQELKDLGVRLAIDDFGTGYSSLSYLHKLPFDVLKIDRSFINPVGDDVANGAEIVRAVIDLAHNLGMAVIAEGVETVEQADGLKALGCEYAQGFLFSEALGPDAVQEMLKKR